MNLEVAYFLTAGWFLAFFRRPQDLPWMLASLIVPARVNRRLNR